jgi:hypothetical protein
MGSSFLGQIEAPCPSKMGLLSGGTAPASLNVYPVESEGLSIGLFADYP